VKLKDMDLGDKVSRIVVWGDRKPIKISYGCIKKIPNYPVITPIDKKAEIIESMGVDYLIVIEFNDKIMNMPKEEFMANMKKMITCLLAAFGLTTGCCQQNFENADPERFAALITHADVVLLDVRTAAEFEEITGVPYADGT